MDKFGGQASWSSSCSEKYEWKNLILYQSEQATRDHPDHDATLHSPLHIPGRVEDSMTEPRGCCDLLRAGGETVSNTNSGSLPCCLSCSKKTLSNRYCNLATCGVKRLGPSHGHGHSSKIHGPGDGVGRCHLSCCSYGGCHGKDHAWHCHSSKRARHSISPEPGPVRSYRSKKISSFDRVPHCAQGVERRVHQAGGSRKNYSANQGSSSQDRHCHDDRYLPTKFLDGHFSEIDAAIHESYIYNFHSSGKNIPVHTKHGQSCQRDEVARAHPKRSVFEFRPIHHEQLELSPNEDFHECLDSSQNYRNAYNGKIVKKKFRKQGYLENTYNGACASKYDRNSSRKRNADRMGAKKARKDSTNMDKFERLCCPIDRNSSRKRNADRLGAKKARKNSTDMDKFKRLCFPIEKDQQQQVESYKMRNDSREGNVKITKIVGQYGSKGNFNPKNPTVPASSGSSKCDENMSSPKCRKTIASSYTPKLSEGSKDMDLESDKQSDARGCTERGILQNIPATHTEKNMQMKESDIVSRSKELRRDCLILLRARQLRKDSAAKADKILKADQQHTARKSKVSTGRRVRSGGPAASSSESDNEDGTASEYSDQFSSATSSDGLQKCGEGRANNKLERPIKFPSNSICNKSPQNMTAQKGLKCSLQLPPEANPFRLAQPKEKEKLLNRRQVSTEHPDAKAHSSLNGYSDTCKVDQAAVSHCDNSAHQNISQLETNNADSHAGRKEKPGVKCEKKAGGHGAKLPEQSTGLYIDPTLLDKETVARCSMHDTLKVNALKTPNHEIGSTPFDGSILPRGTANMCQKDSINRSSESYCRDFKIWLDGNDCRDNQQETMYHNVLRKNQECSLLAETEDELNEKTKKEGCQPQACRVEVTSNQQITSEDCTSDPIHSGSGKQDDCIRCSSIPDLNCSPSMISDEYLMAPPEEPVCQVTADSFKPQSITNSLSASLTGPTLKEEQFKQVDKKQCKQAESNQITREVCKEDTSEAATQLQISESNTGPPQRSAVEESSTSMDAFKCGLCEFVKSFVKPLWENGLLSREVHKIVVKKAVEKVVDAWGSSAPSTQMDVSRILSDEAENIKTLVKAYLQMYVGREILKKMYPR